MKAETILLLRPLLIFFLIGTVVVQALVLPQEAALQVDLWPEFAYLRWPTLIGCIGVVACIQAAVWCVWRLLSLVERGQIFSETAFRWVNGIIYSTAGATGLVIALTCFYIVTNAFQPGVILMAGAGVTCGLIVAMVMMVMRALLRQATTMSADLDEVI